MEWRGTFGKTVSGFDYDVDSIRFGSFGNGSGWDVPWAAFSTFYRRHAALVPSLFLCVFENKIIAIEEAEKKERERERERAACVFQYLTKIFSA